MDFWLLKRISVSEEKFGEIIVVMRFLGSKSLWAGILGSLDSRISGLEFLGTGNRIRIEIFLKIFSTDTDSRFKSQKSITITYSR